MRTVIITISLLTAIQANSQVNKFIFASGMEFNVWNKDMLNGNLIYMNNPTDDNYKLYMEAVKTVESLGGDFNSPDEDNSVCIDGETASDIIYEKNSSVTGTYVHRVYKLEGKTVTVFISNINSSIRVE